MAAYAARANANAGSELLFELHRVRGTARLSIDDQTGQFNERAPRAQKPAALDFR